MAVAIFPYVRQQRGLHRRVDDLAAAVEGFARGAADGPPVVEEEPTERQRG